MTDNTQPEALRLADTLDLAPENGIEPQTAEDAAAELRRQHTRIAELEAQLESIGAGGVSGPLMDRAADHFPGVTKMAARWYMVNKAGMATLCSNKADAQQEAADAQRLWPHMGPHRAVQLVEAADVEAMRAGYDAARLEIESLQARIKTMAEEHADELMVAHLDGRMRAEQAIPGVQWQCGPQANGFTPQQPATSVKAASQPAPVPTSATGGDWTQSTTVALRLGDVMQLLCGGKRPPDDMVQQWLDNTNESLQEFAASNGPAWAQGIGLIDAAMMMVDQPTEIRTTDNPDRDHEHRAARAPADSGAAPSQQVIVDFAQVGTAGPFAVVDGRVSLPDATMQDLVHMLRPTFNAQAADSVLEDAARYRYLRDGDWREHEKLESVIRLQLNTLWDETIDAARAAQEGK